MGVVAQFNFAQSHTYKAGQLVYNDGVVYIVTKDDPDGLPVNQTDYIALLGTRGDTGPAGPVIAPTYNAAQASTYVVDQLIVYNAKLYQVLNAPPDGTPGTSADYLAVS
jgi:hypothetical protein